MIINTEEIVTQAQAAKRLGISAMQVTKLVRIYNIPTEDIGRIHLVRFGDVRGAWLKQSQKQGSINYYERRKKAISA